MRVVRFYLLALALSLPFVVPAQAQSSALRFVPVSPCRVADTRVSGTAISAQSSRDFPVAGTCGIPLTAAAYSMNVTAIPPGYLGYISVWPKGQTQPLVSTLNSLDGRIKANAAILPAGTNGMISIFSTDNTDIVLDINGYFVDATTNPNALAFFALPPCRVADTRNSTGALGGPSLVAAQPRSFPVLSSTCNIPATAQAYSLNMTVVPHRSLGYLSTWPTGLQQPLVSTLNALTGTLTANAAIVPAGVNGAISVYATDDSDLIIDINGYFAPSTSPNDLSLFTLPPCRVLDTRLTTGSFLAQMNPPEDTTAAPCGVIPDAQAVVLNATVLPAQTLGYLSLWPGSQVQPLVSTLNALDGFITSNMAIVPTTQGVINAYVTDNTNLVLDTSGYFASGTGQAPPTDTLSVARFGSGTGTVTSLDGKLDCGSTCSVSYVSGTTVTLTASAAAGSTFDGWSGACTGTDVCTVNLTSAQSVGATFNTHTLGHLSLQSTTVGANLETLAIGSLDNPPSQPLTVTITSSDPTKVVLVSATADPTGVTQGTAQITGTVAPGLGRFGFGFPGMWVQGLSSSGTANITMTAPGYAPATATVTLTPSGFLLNGPNGTGNNFTAFLGSSSDLTVSPAQLDTGGNVISTQQALRGGMTANVTVSSSNTDTGTIANNPAAVQPGKSVSTAVKFQSNGLGSSLISVAQPTGFAQPNSGTQLTATVVSPTITLNPLTVGYDLQVFGAGSLNVAPTAPLQVTITSADPSKVLLTTNPSLTGTGTITVTVPVNQRSLPAFYVQGLAAGGTVQLTATASGYTSANANVVLTASAFLVNGLNGDGNDFSTTNISPPTSLTVDLWQLDTGLRPFTQGTLRPGVTVTVGMNNQNTAAGTISATSVDFHGGDGNNSAIQFQPAASCTTACTTLISLVQPTGFSTPTSGSQLNITVGMPTVSPRMSQTVVGNNLQVHASGAIDAASSTPLSVTITSDNPTVLLSTSATTRGSQSITLQVPANTGVNGIGFPGYYVQATASSGTANLTASASGYKSSSITVSMAPSGFLVNSTNGIGGDFAAALSNQTTTVSVSAVVLDPATFAPTQTVQQLMGGFSQSVAVTNDNPAVALTPASVTVLSGNDSASLTLQLQSKGTAHIGVGTPTGFSTPTSGNPVTLVVF